LHIAGSLASGLALFGLLAASVRGGVRKGTRSNGEHQLKDCFHAVCGEVAFADPGCSAASDTFAN